jgi:hypothetical protein
VSIFDGNDPLIGHRATEQSFSNIRSAANEIKTVCSVNAASAEQRKN